MQVTIKKKTLKIIIGIILAIVIITIGVFVTRYISTNIKIADTKKKLSQIDSIELQEKLIEELENSKLYLEIDADYMFVGTMIKERITFEDYITLSYVCIKNGSPVGAVEIPCFKITSDTNGKFKTIEYVETTAEEYIVPNIVEKVFKDNYDIDLKIVGNAKYNTTFNRDILGYTNKGQIYISDDNFYIGILNKIGNLNIEYGDRLVNSFKEYRTQIFGADYTGGIIIKNEDNVSIDNNIENNELVENKINEYTNELEQIVNELNTDTTDNTSNINNNSTTMPNLPSSNNSNTQTTTPNLPSSNNSNTQTTTSSNSSNNKPQKEMVQVPWFSMGYELKGYTDDLDRLGIKYKVVKGQDLEYENNTVIKVEHNGEYVEKGSTITITVADNTYNMQVYVHPAYLINLAGFGEEYYNKEEYSISLKINGTNVFNGKLPNLMVENAPQAGTYKGKLEGLKIEATIEGRKITKEINYAVFGGKEPYIMIYAGGSIGLG